MSLLPGPFLLAILACMIPLSARGSEEVWNHSQLIGPDNFCEVSTPQERASAEQVVWIHQTPWSFDICATREEIFHELLSRTSTPHHENSEVTTALNNLATEIYDIKLKKFNTCNILAGGNWEGSHPSSSGDTMVKVLCGLALYRVIIPPEEMPECRIVARQALDVILSTAPHEQALTMDAQQFANSLCSRALELSPPLETTQDQFEDIEMQTLRDSALGVTQAVGRWKSSLSLTRQFSCPFHRDPYTLSLVDWLMKHAHVFVETGAYHGSSLAYVARLYPHVQCYSCEPDMDFLRIARQRTEKLGNVHIAHMMSQDFLRELSQNASLTHEKTVLFWLDAHWFGFEFPLQREVEMISTHFKNACFLIDDFKVPGDSSFSHDAAGEHECSYEHIRNHISPDTKHCLFYPSSEDMLEDPSLPGGPKELCKGRTGWGLICLGERLCGHVGGPAKPFFMKVGEK